MPTDKETAQKQQNRTASQADRHLEELLTLRLRGLVTDDEYVRRKQELTSERNEALVAAQAGKEAEAHSWKVAEKSAEFCVHVPRSFTVSDANEKARIARELGVRYELRRGKLVVELDGILGLVRERNEKAALSLGLIEPLENGSGSGKQGCSIPVCQGWGDLLDAIRAKAYADGLTFNLPAAWNGKP